MNNAKRIAAILTYCRLADSGHHTDWCKLEISDSPIAACNCGYHKAMNDAMRMLSDLGRTDRDLFYWS